MKRRNKIISALLFRKRAGHVKNGPKNVQKAPSRSLTSEVEQKLLRILSHDAFVNTGCIQLLGLDQIKNRIGKDWLKRKDKILDALAQIVSRRTRKEDVFFSKSDEEHIIVFASLTEKEAQFVCAKILQELSDKFLGHADTKDIIVRTATGKINGELVFQSTSLEDLLDSISRSSGQNTGPLEVDTTRRHAISENGKTLPNASSEIRNKIEQDVSVYFVPIWDSKHEVISTYALNCRFNAKTYFKLNDYETISKYLGTDQLIDLDHFLFKDSYEILQEFFINSFRAIFNVPVSYETLFTPERLQAYLQLCNELPKNMRKYLSFSLINFPPGVPASKLRYITSVLSKYCRTIILCCHDSIPQDLKLYKESGIRGISINLNHADQQVDHYWQELKQMTRTCARYGLETALLSVNNSDDLLRSRQSGFKYITGAVLGEGANIPGHMVHLSWKELLAGKKPSF